MSCVCVGKRITFRHMAMNSTTNIHIYHVILFNDKNAPGKINPLRVYKQVFEFINVDNEKLRSTFQNTFRLVTKSIHTRPLYTLICYQFNLYEYCIKRMYMVSK